MSNAFSSIYTLTHRLKSFGFNEQEIAVEIPKPLLLGDVAVRVMWPPYDPLTRQVTKRSGDDGNKAESNGATEDKSSTVADNAESVQLENNEVLKMFACYIFNFIIILFAYNYTKAKHARNVTHVYVYWLILSITSQLILMYCLL